MLLTRLHKFLSVVFQPKLKSLFRFSLFVGLCFVLGLYLVVVSPDDYLQGVYYKIMYIHVPAAWISMGLYILMGIISFGYIIYKNPLYAIISESICPVGLAFTAIVLFTGSMWGVPTWGTWWIWDARLTSMLVLFFIYVGCMALRNNFINDEIGSIVTGYFCVFGLINIPIIKFSVDVWNTLHQPASFIKFSGPTVHISMMPPLLVMLIAMIGIAWVAISLLVMSKQMERKYKRCCVR